MVKRITKKEINYWVGWGLLGLGSFMVLDPLQRVLLLAVNQRLNLLMLLRQMWAESYVGIFIGSFIVIASMYLFKIK